MTNHVRRTMHILDVISSVSRSSKCSKIYYKKSTTATTTAAAAAATATATTNSN